MNKIESNVIDDIKGWSKEVLEIPNPHLSGLKACPYAEKAWKDNKVDVLTGENIDDLKSAICRFNPGKKDMVIWTTFNLKSYDVWDRWVTKWNKKNAVKDLHLMLFHPDYPPEKGNEDYLLDNDWQSSVDDYVMVFIQSLKALNKASVALEGVGYYRKFPTHIFETLVLERRRLENGYG